jgi:tRNA dimethylallyltransferase
VVLLVGATAVGKSALLEALVPPLRAWRAEVINADSRQVYRGLDTGTAKPSPRLRRLLPHHLIDVVDPEVQFTAGDFVRAAERLIAEIHRRNGSPVIAGGAAFYLWSFLHGLSSAPPADPRLRGKLQQRVRREGAAALHRELALHDPATAARLPVGDVNRIVRALEVHQLTGRPLSAFRPPDGARRDYGLLTLGLQRERPELYARIDRRVEEMFASGLAAEVAALRARGFHADTPGMRSIGYAEFFREGSPEARRALIQRNSRRFAKRQLTFFRRFPNVLWFSATDVDGVVAALQRLLSFPVRVGFPAPN